MADVKIETIRSVSSGTVGRAESRVRGARLRLDSSSRPHDDVFTNSEAFLAGVSSCGVTLIEMHAQETGVPVTHLAVTIQGVRPTDVPRFDRVTMTFEFDGVTQAQADALVETYRSR
jgi:uncharacterized OsmC-like protein